MEPITLARCIVNQDLQGSHYGILHGDLVWFQCNWGENGQRVYESYLIEPDYCEHHNIQPDDPQWLLEPIYQAYQPSSEEVLTTTPVMLVEESDGSPLGSSDLD